MTKQENTIIWIVGIILLLVVLSQTDILPQFAIVTEIICIDNTLDFYDCNDGPIPGKIGNALEFNTTNSIYLPPSEGDFVVMWIKNYTRGDTDYFFIADLNGTNYVNGALDNTKKIIPLGPGFGLGFNGSVDIIGTFSNLSVPTMLEIYNSGAGRDICYTTTYEENVTCKDYATSQVTDTGTGCLNYSGDFFPNCDYVWEDTDQFKIEDNKCIRSFYCQNPCLASSGCYETNQTCITNLTYLCYVIENNQCIFHTDYATCTGSDIYKNSTACEDDLLPGTSTTTTTGTISDDDGTFKEKLGSEVFTIAGFKITLLHLIIVLIIVLLGLYLVGAFNKK